MSELSGEQSFKSATVIKAEAVKQRGAANSLFQDVLFLLLLRCGQAHGFLPLVVHHLLHHPACLSVQIRQLRGRKIRRERRTDKTQKRLKPADFYL